MRTAAARAGIAVAAGAVVVGLFLLASRSDDGTKSAVIRPPVAEGATGGQSKARVAAARRAKKSQRTPASQAPKRPPPTIANIVVRDGKPADGVKRLEYRRGERVQFSVQSDSADEVHVHGFNVTKALPATHRVRFGFPADIEGVFEVELHGTHTKIAELRIKP
jgi:hypothetical protein